MPSTAVQRALDMSDIQREIFSALGPDITESSNSLALSIKLSSNKKALANAAVCCRKFLNPALDILWRVMTSIEPLLSILPTFQNEDEPCTFTGAIESLHWTRFQRYARRIRHLQCENVPEIDSFTCVRIARLLKGEPLLPLLYSLVYALEPNILLLASPTLRHITIDANVTAEDYLQCFLPALVDISLLLHTLHVKGDALSQSCIQAITQLPSLTGLTLDLISIDVFTIGQIFRLQNLEMVKLTLKISPMIIPQSTPTALRSLRLLSLKATSRFINTFIAQIASHHLEQLELVQIWPATGGIPNHTNEHWTLCLEQIAQWSHSLYDLTIASDIPPARLALQGTFSFPLLEKIYPFKNLKNLTIDLDFNVIISAEDPVRMTNAWQKMENLHFQQAYSSLENSRFCFPTLQLIASRWPNLRILQLPLDLCDLPQQRTIFSHQLETLRITSVIFEDSVLLAQHLDSLFPLMEFDIPDEDDCEDWEQVVQIKDACRGAREDQEARQ